MNREWVHTNHRISPWNNSPRRGFSNFSYDYQSRNKLQIYLLIVPIILCIGLLTGFSAYNIYTGSNKFFTTGKRYSDDDFRDFFSRNNTTVKKDNFMSDPLIKLKVSFIANKIKKANPKVDAEELATTIVYHTSNIDYDPIFVTAVILAESNFKNTAVSRVGARGLMQIMPNTAKHICDKMNISWLGDEWMDQSEYNIMLGVNYLKFLSSELYDNNLEHTLIGYNWGPGKFSRAVASQGRHVQLPLETIRYKRRVLSHYYAWKEEFEEDTEGMTILANS